MKTWTTKDGRTIPIKDMSDQHLANTIGYLVRNGKGVRLHLLKAIRHYLNSHPPQGAQDAVERAEQAILDTDKPHELHPAWPELIREASRRGLQIGPTRKHHVPNHEQIDQEAWFDSYHSGWGDRD